MSDPPRWAESLLVHLLTSRDRDVVSGDLLEEYRESILPASGKWRADLWYARQVAWFLWQASWPWGAAVATALVLRRFLDTFAPPMDYGPRSAVTTWVAAAALLAVGCHTAYRTGHARSGTLVALAAHTVGQAASTILTGVLFVGVVQHEPRMLALFRATGGWEEELFLPIMLLPIVIALGTIGGVMGKGLQRLSSGAAGIRS